MNGLMNRGLKSFRAFELQLRLRLWIRLYAARMRSVRSDNFSGRPEASTQLKFQVQFSAVIAVVVGTCNESKSCAWAIKAQRRVTPRVTATAASTSTAIQMTKNEGWTRRRLPAVAATAAAAAAATATNTFGLARLDLARLCSVRFGSARLGFRFCAACQQSVIYWVEKKRKKQQNIKTTHK